MAESFLLGPQALAQIRQLWRAWSAELINPDAGHRRAASVNESEELQGFLAADLEPATDERTGETTALLDVWYRDPASGDLLNAHRQVTVTNRYTDFSRSAGDYLSVFFIEDEWRPHVAGGAGGVVLATLAETLCSTDPCASVTCAVGYCGGDPPTKACNPLKKSAQEGDVVVLAPVSLCGPGVEAGCDGEPCLQAGEGQECEAAQTSDEQAQWIILAVEAKSICIITAGGERRGDCIVLPQLTIAAEFCRAERCGDAVGSVLDSGGDCGGVNLEFGAISESADCCP